MTEKFQIPIEREGRNHYIQVGGKPMDIPIEKGDGRITIIVPRVMTFEIPREEFLNKKGTAFYEELMPYSVLTPIEKLKNATDGIKQSFVQMTGRATREDVKIDHRGSKKTTHPTSGYHHIEIAMIEQKYFKMKVDQEQHNIIMEIADFHGMGNCPFNGTIVFRKNVDDQGKYKPRAICGGVDGYDNLDLPKIFIVEPLMTFKKNAAVGSTEETSSLVRKVTVDELSILIKDKTSFKIRVSPNELQVVLGIVLGYDKEGWALSTTNGEYISFQPNGYGVDHRLWKHDKETFNKRMVLDEVSL